jgi:hypothetical protein
MENNDYPATGSLFVAKTKRSEKSPDYSGMMEFEMDVVDDLIKQKEEGISKPKVNLVGWKKVSKAGNPYLRIIANIERDRQEGQQGQTSYEKPKQGETIENVDLDDEIPF